MQAKSWLRSPKGLEDKNKKKKKKKSPYTAKST